MVHKTSEGSNGLLSRAGTEEAQVFERKQTQYKDLSKEFVDTKNDFSKQFAHMYTARLAELRDVLVPRVKAKWGSIPIAKLADLENLHHQQCIIIGTLYKHQQWKPSILRALSEDHRLAGPCSRTDYCSEKDESFLEDEMLRIKLVGKQVNLKDIVTGVVCAVLGNENKDGTFTVEDWCFPGCVPKKSLTKCRSTGKIVIVSGLNLSTNLETLGTSLFVEWLCGMAGNTTIQKDGTSIVRLIIAGNTVQSDDTSATDVSVQASGQIIKTTDDFLSNLAQCCYITLMPGKNDPTNAMLPQRPLHPCLLPKSSRLESFKSAPNPWIGQIENRVIIGTSGQSIDDIMKASGETSISPLKWLERTLLWRHICPTAPDTLLACPFDEKDLFIMKECPDIYFIGNTNKFETTLWQSDDNQKVRIICVPRFDTTQTAVIVDLENLETQYISFGSMLSDT